MDHKWICRMILKRMRLGIGTRKLLEIMHPKAPLVFMKYNHLSKVIETIENGEIDLVNLDHDDEIELFHPVRPMLCERLTSSSRKFFIDNHRNFYQETKMDGERFQLHIKDKNFCYYSRNGHEYSESFNQVLTPLIKFRHMVHSIILDGEMLVYDVLNKCYQSKGEFEVDVKKMKLDNISKLRPCFCVFDVLYFNGNSQIARRYEERLDLLTQLFDDIEGVLVKTKPSKVMNLDHMLEIFNQANFDGEEGTVLKNADSIYKPNQRSAGWFKVKADYFDDQVVMDLDFIVIGGSYVNSYQKTYIKKFMLGAIEKTSDDKYLIHSVAEVSGGISNMQHVEIRNIISKHIKSHDCSSKIVEFDKGKILFKTKTPDFWIPPNYSLVFECKASELVRSNDFMTEFTLRFPRVVEIRKDKIWTESCSLKEFNNISLDQGSKKGGVKKLVMRNVTKNDLNFNVRSKLRNKTTNPNADDDDVKVLDNILDGKEFCVLLYSPDIAKTKEIIARIKSHGGTIVEQPRKNKTFAIVCDRKTVKVENHLKIMDVNIINSEWVLRELRDEELFQFPLIRPQIDSFFTTKTLKIDQNKHFDEYGDSHREPFENLSEFESFLKKVKVNGNEDLLEFENELEERNEEKFNIFNGICGIFLSRKTNFLLEHSRKIFILKKGIVKGIEEISENNFVICADDEKIYYITQFPSQKVISFKWIIDSSNVNKLLKIQDY